MNEFETWKQIRERIEVLDRYEIEYELTGKAGERKCCGLNLLEDGQLVGKLRAWHSSTWGGSRGARQGYEIWSPRIQQGLRHDMKVKEYWGVRRVRNADSILHRVIMFCRAESTLESQANEARKAAALALRERNAAHRAFEGCLIGQAQEVKAALEGDAFERKQLLEKLNRLQANWESASDAYVRASAANEAARAAYQDSLGEADGAS